MYILTVCRMDESWVKRSETVVTNEKEAARMIKLVRPRWKRSDLVLQVSFWCCGKSLISYHHILWEMWPSLMTSVFLHCVQTTAGWLITSTTVRRGCSFRPCQGFILHNLHHLNVWLLTSRDSVEKVSQVQSLLANQGLAPALEATFANGLVTIMRIVINIAFIIITIGRQFWSSALSTSWSWWSSPWL